MNQQITIPNLETRMPIRIGNMIDASIASVFVGYATNSPTVILWSELAFFGSLGLGLGFRLLDKAVIKARNIKKIDFKEVYGVDINNLQQMSLEDRVEEFRELTNILNDTYVPQEEGLKKLAPDVLNILAEYIGRHTGQKVVYSSRIRIPMIIGKLFPHKNPARVYSTDEILFYNDLGIFNPFCLAHEFTHRYGYRNEIQAQVLAYFSLMESGNPQYTQSARATRLESHLYGICERDDKLFEQEFATLRPELRDEMIAIASPQLNFIERLVEPFSEITSKLKNKVRKTNISDYTEGFTNFLYTAGERVK